MLKYIISFLLVAIIAGVLGFAFMTGAAATVAKYVFWFSLVSFIFALLYDPKARNSEI